MLLQNKYPYVILLQSIVIKYIFITPRVELARRQVNSNIVRSCFISQRHN